MTDIREEIPAGTRRELLSAALELADLCSETTASIIESGFEVSKKADASLVTTADVETERAFRQRVQERFPDMGVLGEELGEVNKDADYRWVIDPIDGTAEFARQVPLYGCIIGLQYKQQPLLGVIDHRAMGLRCHGAYGLGAFANGERLHIVDSSNGESGAVSRIGLPSLASFLSPRDASPREPGIRGHRRRLSKLSHLPHLLLPQPYRHGRTGRRHGVADTILGCGGDADSHRRGRWSIPMCKDKPYPG
jgi:hypothetical protein